MIKPDRTTGLLGCLILSCGLAGSAAAYETYNDGCQTCHGAFTSGSSTRGQTIRFNDKHDMHRNGNGGMQAACPLCHLGQNDDPLIGDSDGTGVNPGIGCTGCHKAEGLRAHHKTSGINGCDDCHGDDSTPEPEDVEPRYYGTRDTLADLACNVFPTESLNENWTVGDSIGLDNDGDGLYDADDPDCADQVPNPVAPVAKAGKDQFVADRDDDGAEDVTLDGSKSSDEDGDIASYQWREDGQVIAQGVNPTVSFGVGLHTVELTVTDEENLSDTDVVKIRVFADPVDLATTIRDANGNSSADFVMALLDEAAGRFNAYLRDGADGSAIRKINLGAAELRLLAALRDVSGNGRDELLVLTINDAGEVQVRLFDTGNRKQLGKIKFQKNLEPFELLALNDRLGGLGGRAVAVVQTGAGTVQAQVKDALSGAKIKTLQFSPAYEPIGAATVRDIDGNNVEEVVVFGVHADGRVRAQLLDALTGGQVARYFFNANFAPVAVAAIPSMNNNTSDDLVVLGINDAGKVRAEVIDSRTGKVLAKVTYDRDFPPLAMTYVEHPDGAALGVLGENAAGKRRVRTKLLKAATSVGLVTFPAAIAPDNLTALEDTDGSTVGELLQVGEIASGDVRAIAKDATSGTELYKVTLP